MLDRAVQRDNLREDDIVSERPHDFGQVAPDQHVRHGGPGPFRSLEAAVVLLDQLALEAPRVPEERRRDPSGGTGVGTLSDMTYGSG